MIPSTNRSNRLAIISLIAAVFTFTSFCIGVAPIPLTAWICYPLAVILGVVAFFTGFIALRQLRASGENGRGMALLGMWMGVLTIIAVACFTVLSIALVFNGLEYLIKTWFPFKP
jgi:hypothetical protein